MSQSTYGTGLCILAYFDLCIDKWINSKSSLFELRPQEFYTPHGIRTLLIRHVAADNGRSKVHVSHDERHDCKLCLGLSFYWF